MRDVTFDLTQSQPLVIGATGMEAIIQNLRMILLTLCYSIPLNRAFAHDGQMLDSPAPVITARKTADLVEAIEKYEPRVKVEKLEFVYADQKGQLMQGTLTPKITFSLKQGVVL